MKRVIALIMVCILLLGFTACGKAPVFEDQNGMNAYLNGMWCVENSGVYYIFQDGKVYTTSDSQFEYTCKSLMDAAVKNKNIKPLIQLSFEKAVNSFVDDGFSECDVSMNPKKGIVVIDKDKTYEKQIVVNENTVMLKEADEKIGKTLEKVSDEIDFSGEHFKEIFETKKENYKIPTSVLWTPPSEYATFVRKLNPKIENWVLTSKDDETILYEDNGLVPSIDGFFAVTKEEVLYNSKITVNKDWSPAFFVNYNPYEHGRITVIDSDNMSLDLLLLCQYIAYAVQEFPGAIEHTELHDILLKEEGTVNNGLFILEKEIGGIKYRLELGTNGTSAYLSATVGETLTFGEYVNYTKKG